MRAMASTAAAHSACARVLPAALHVTLTVLCADMHVLPPCFTIDDILAHCAVFVRWLDAQAAFVKCDSCVRAFGKVIVLRVHVVSCLGPSTDVGHVCSEAYTVCDHDRA